MLSFITPARLAALVGVLTGLSAAATSALDVIPHNTAVGRAVVGAVGVLATVITVAKFLEGQAGWEQQQSAHAHELVVSAVQHAQTKELYTLSPAIIEDPGSAELPGETPLVTVDDTGVVIDQVGADGEPARLAETSA